MPVRYTSDEPVTPRTPVISVEPDGSAGSNEYWIDAVVLLPLPLPQPGSKNAIPRPHNPAARIPIGLFTEISFASATNLDDTAYIGHKTFSGLRYKLLQAPLN